jgi:anaphase-promoting complex subunit 3
VALALFDEAVKLSPENALVRYRRAKMLISMKQYEVRMARFEA